MNVVAMEWHEIEVNGRRSVKFPEKMLPGVVSPVKISEQEHDVNAGYAHKVGGIIKQGEWAWLAHDCTLKILSLRYGQTMSTYEFAEAKGYENCSIKCVAEVFPGNTESVFLAVCLQSYHGASGGGTYVALYSVEHSNVLSCMEMRLHVSCACFMPAMACRRSLLQNFDGCLALGSDEGIVVLVDLNMRKILAGQEKQLLEEAFVPCHIVDYKFPLTDIHRHFRQAQLDGVHFGLQLEVIDTPCAIQCMLPVDLILGLAIGLEDGRLAYYDLAELQIFYIAMPHQQQEMAPLVHMAYLEPTDDPRPCLYIWAMHDNEEYLTAVLHTLMYEKRIMENDGSSSFETFQTSSVRLELPLEATKSVAIACQAISKPSSHVEDDANCLCALTWYSVLEEKNKLLIFDVNQWYKEQMPYILNWKRKTSYLAGYVLSGQQCGVDAYINPSTIAHFNSLQRYEEHFYPVSLSFDSSLLLANGCRSYNWEGAQNRVINIIRASNATIFLEPDVYFQKIIRTRLMPQFCELQANSTFSRKAKHELILSVALEHNCYSVLRDCAKCWADGSFLGNFGTSTGLSLSTLTEWVWKRATDIKARCNDLCKGLFDNAGYPLDRREQKELGFITRQLKLLADLLADVLNIGKQNMSEMVFSALVFKHQSLRMAADYQNVLLWLLSIGLLPEAPPYASFKASRHIPLVPYPYEQLKEIYTKKRVFFGKISDSFVSKKTGNCRLIYIDAFIEHACKGSVLRDFWLENNGDGLYPPTSIESMLRVMLVPEVDFDSKCAILLYFFLDLNMAIDEQRHAYVVSNFIKFPSVFKLSASLIKTVQSFWNLDHGHFLPAVDEFGSPFNNNQNYPQWLLELLIEALLTQNAANLALRILEARPTLISPVLKLKTLLANELISEAFHFARSKNDKSLLELFFTCCLCAGKYGVVRDLALNGLEGQLVQRILKRSKSHGAESLHFVYLLQKSKYLEAVSYMDELSKGRGGMRSNFGTATDTPNLVLSAFNTTMAPVTQGLTDVYFRIKNKIKLKEADNRSPVPLSCQLIKQNANNLLGGIYHSSALSAHFATYYWGELEHNRRDNSNLLSSNNAPFLRKPQGETLHMDYMEQDAISYPQTYKVSEKRSLAERELHNTSCELERQTVQQNPKKRRRLLGDEIVSDFTHFMELHKPTKSAHTSDFSFQTNAAAATSQATINEKEQCFLTQPLANSRVAPREDITKPSTAALANTEIHGILKTHTPEPAERFTSRREQLADEEKSLRFKLPTGEFERDSPQKSEPTPTCGELLPGGEKNLRFKLPSKESQRQLAMSSEIAHKCQKVLIEEEKSIRFELPDIKVEQQSTERPKTVSTRRSLLADEDNSRGFTFSSTTSPVIAFGVEEQAMELIVGLQPVTEPIMHEKNKDLTRSISVDSSASSNSSKTPSDDNFYSPLSSQNVSLANDSGRAKERPEATPALQQTASRISFLAGPQPRKPLARLSAERSEKSLTPEPLTETAPKTLSTTESQQALTTPTVSSAKLTMSQGSSGFGSFTWQQPTPTTTAVSSLESSKPFGIQIIAVSSLASADIHEFAPTVSSSRVSATQSRFVSDKTHVKLSECSTVVGNFSEIEATIDADKPPKNSTIDKDNSAGEDTEVEKQMLDTTLGMSSYDLTLLDATAVQPAKSPINKQTAEIAEVGRIVTETEIQQMEEIEQAEEIQQVVEIKQAETVELYEDMEATTATVSSKAAPTRVTENETDLYNIALGLQNVASTRKETVAQTSEQFVVISSPTADSCQGNDREVEEDAVIVLSSSSADSEASSSSILSSLPVRTDGDSSDNAEEYSDRIESADEIELSDDDDEVSVADYVVEEVSETEEDADDEIDDEQHVSGDEESAGEHDETNDADEDASNEVSDESIAEEYYVRAINDESNDVEEVVLVIETDVLPQESEIIAEVNVSDEEMQVEQEHVPKIIEHKIVIEAEQEIETEKENVVAQTEPTVEQIQIVEEQADARQASFRALKEKVAVIEEQADPRNAPSDTKEEQVAAIEEQSEIIDKEVMSMEEQVVIIDENISSIEEEMIVITEGISARVEEVAAPMEDKEAEVVIIEDHTVSIDDEEGFFEADDISFRNRTPTSENQESAVENQKDVSQIQSEIHTENVSETGIPSLVGDNLLTSATRVMPDAVKSTLVGYEKKTEHIQTETVDEIVTVSEDVPEELMEAKQESSVHKMPLKIRTKAEIEKDAKIGEKQIIEVVDESTAEQKEKASVTQVAENEQVTSAAKDQVSDAEEDIHLHVDDEDTNEENEEKRTVTEISERAVVKPTIQVVEQISVKDSAVVNAPKTNRPKDAKSPSPIELTSKTDESEEQAELTTRKRIISFSRIEAVDEAGTNTPQTEETLHGTTLPPSELDIEERNIDTPRRRHTRGISVPPQTLAEDAELIVVTAHTRRRNLRASSLQPKSLLEEEDLDTLQMRRRMHSTSVSPQEYTTSAKTSTGHNSAAPPAKGSLRSRTFELDKTDEATGNSPAFHTRLRTRLSSMDSERDSPVVSSPQMKRTRRSSMTSNMSEQPQTPKRTRRNSITSQPDSMEAIHNLRSRSVVTVQDEAHETDSGKSTPKDIAAKHRQSTAEKLIPSTPPLEENSEDDANEHADVVSKIKKFSSKDEIAGPTAASYSSSRRLTRTQLAIMEKSAALAASTPTTSGTSIITILPPINERNITKRGGSRSTVTQDSDDTESMSSHLSSLLSNPAVKRVYATRSSVKDKDEVDDDLKSVVSSIGSGRFSKRRSKEKASPNTTLTAIPEEEVESKTGSKKRGRTSKKQ